MTDLKQRKYKSGQWRSDPDVPDKELWNQFVVNTSTEFFSEQVHQIAWQILVTGDCDLDAVKALTTGSGAFAEGQDTPALPGMSSAATAALMSGAPVSSPAGPKAGGRKPPKAAGAAVAAAAAPGAATPAAGPAAAAGAAGPAAAAGAAPGEPPAEGAPVAKELAKSALEKAKDLLGKVSKEIQLSHGYSVQLKGLNVSGELVDQCKACSDELSKAYHALQQLVKDKKDTDEDSGAVEHV